MPLEESILKSTKKTLGLDVNYNEFDLDVATYINTCFDSLRRLGLGPAGGFMIEGEEEVWDDFIDDDMSINSVKTYIYLKVRLLFDPPGTSYHINAIEEQIRELEHTLLTERNLVTWAAPSSSPSLP